MSLVRKKEGKRGNPARLWESSGEAQGSRPILDQTTDSEARLWSPEMDKRRPAACRLLPLCLL